MKDFFGAEPIGDIVGRMSLTRELLERQNQCSATAHPRHYMAQITFRNGKRHVGFWCDLCNRVVTRELGIAKGPYLSRDRALSLLAPDASLEDLPIVQPELSLRQCFYCRAVAPCEDDHVMERAIHGDFAEDGPIVPACQPCHQRKTNNLQDFIKRLRGNTAA